MKTIILFAFCVMHLETFSQQADWANFGKYAAENKRLAAPLPKEKRVVFMGNSITEGWKIVDSAFFAGRSYINRGISGQTTSQMLSRFRPDVIELKPAAVVILAGINDIAENTGPISNEAIAGNIASMVQLALANRIKVILCSILPANRFSWRPNVYPADRVIAVNKLLKAFAATNRIVYVDYYTEMADTEKGLPKKYAEDGVHPNLEGYKVMERLVEEGISKTLQNRARK